MHHYASNSILYSTPPLAKVKQIKSLSTTTPKQNLKPTLFDDNNVGHFFKSHDKLLFPGTHQTSKTGMYLVWPVKNL